jgi:hypothetical protein
MTARLPAFLCEIRKNFKITRSGPGRKEKRWIIKGWIKSGRIKEINNKNVIKDKKEIS